MALPDELLGNIGDDPFGASIELGRYAFPQWGDLCDLHRIGPFHGAGHKDPLVTHVERCPYGHRLWNSIPSALSGD